VFLRGVLAHAVRGNHHHRHLVRLGAGQPDPAEHRVVRRPEQPADDLDLAVAQDFQRGCAVEHAS